MINSHDGVGYDYALDQCATLKYPHPNLLQPIVENQNHHLHAFVKCVSPDHHDGRMVFDVGHMLQNILALPPIINEVVFTPFPEGDGRGGVGCSIFHRLS